MSEKGFGKWREKLWPIHSFELKKFLPLILMKFFISLNYGILTCLKDTMVVTSKGSGAEAIPVLKGWVVLPVAIAATLIYSKLSNFFKKPTLFYSTLGLFLLIVFSYGFILCPNEAFFSPSASADWMIAKFGVKFSHWIAVYRNWIHSLLFVTAELWGSMIILLLFWGFANQITSVQEAKRSYTVYIAAGDLAALTVGPLIYGASQKFSHLPFIHTIKFLSSCVVIVGFIVMALYWYINRVVLTDKRFYNPQENSLKEKTKLSLREGLKHIAKSRYLRYIAVLVIAYGLAFSLVEITWKAHLKILYPNPADYQSFMGTIFSLVGLASFIASIFFCGGIIRAFGWLFSAQATPIVIGITGVLFYLLVIYQGALTPHLASLGITPLLLIVFYGAFQNVSTKVMKYSFFDPTKEMAYIPLSQEEQVKGKAAIDVVGSRLGKSGSAWIQVGLIDLIGTGSILSITHYLVPIVIVAIVGWMYSVKNLNKEFLRKTKEEHADSLAN